jgi:hypothetical protein
MVSCVCHTGKELVCSCGVDADVGCAREGVCLCVRARSSERERVDLGVGLGIEGDNDTLRIWQALGEFIELFCVRIWIVSCVFHSFDKWTMQVHLGEDSRRGSPGLMVLFKQTTANRDGTSVHTEGCTVQKKEEEEERL